MGIVGIETINRFDARVNCEKSGVPLPDKCGTLHYIWLQSGYSFGNSRTNDPEPFRINGMRHINYRVYDGRIFTGALFSCAKNKPIVFINCAKMEIKRGLLSLILNLAILKVDYHGTPL